MIYIGAFIALQVIVLVAYWLMKKNNPQGVLMVAGILMLALSMLLGMHSLSLTETTGTPVFDLFRIIKETFSSNMLRGRFDDYDYWRLCSLHEKDKG